MREVALQICPQFQKDPNMSHSTALSRSALEVTMAGDLPAGVGGG